MVSASTDRVIHYVVKPRVDPLRAGVGSIRPEDMPKVSVGEMHKLCLHYLDLVPHVDCCLKSKAARYLKDACNEMIGLANELQKTLERTSADVMARNAYLETTVQEYDRYFGPYKAPPKEVFDKVSALEHENLTLKAALAKQKRAHDEDMKTAKEEMDALLASHRQVLSRDAPSALPPPIKITCYEGDLRASDKPVTARVYPVYNTVRERRGGSRAGDAPAEPPSAAYHSDERAAEAPCTSAASESADPSSRPPAVGPPSPPATRRDAAPRFLPATSHRPCMKTDRSGTVLPLRPSHSCIAKMRLASHDRMTSLSVKKRLCTS